MVLETKIVDYLISLGYERIPREIPYSEPNSKYSVKFNPLVFEKGNIRIEYDNFFGTDFKIYRDGEKVFDISEQTRFIPFAENKQIKSQNIPMEVKLSEVQEAIRDLNITDLLDE